MSFFNFNKNPDRALRQHPLLKGKKLIGRGLMSGVFDCDDECVYVVTCDRAKYLFYQELCDGKHAFFPKVLEDHGSIARDVKLLRVERLEKRIRRASGQGEICIRQGRGQGVETQACRTPQDWVRLLNWVADYTEHDGGKLRRTEPWAYQAGVLRVAAWMGQSEPHHQALIALSDFIGDARCTLDLQPSNFMYRGAALVFNDPVSHMGGDMDLFAGW
ncbi:hypothetical protein [Castellaniella sp.]|uniref:hypothetical protein n=1 Tax=Castellaniella sp. TaxID=1955812 RepID=UPI002AFFA8DA|nr:hypothetical protein [Castellaniella sp.]